MDYSSASDPFFEERIEDLVNNDKRRESIEAKLEPMQIDDLILHNELRQTVPLLGGRLKVVFRSTSGEEDLGVKQLLDDLSANNARFMLDSFSLMNACLGVRSVGKAELPPVLDEKERFSPTLFEVRYRRFLKFPQVVLRDIVINFVWFDRRVQKVVVAEELGNG